LRDRHVDDREHSLDEPEVGLGYLTTASDDELPSLAAL
jgi:hypothetical protein